MFSYFSYISGIAILGIPAEMYVYGTQLWCVVIPDCFVSLTMAVVYLPVFYKLQITSSYEVGYVVLWSYTGADWLREKKSHLNRPVNFIRGERNK